MSAQDGPGLVTIEGPLKALCQRGGVEVDEQLRGMICESDVPGWAVGGVDCHPGDHLEGFAANLQERVGRGGPARGALMAWLSPILENISHVYVSACSFAVVATTSSARSDGATNYTRCSIKLP